jgi:hypothetical protein
VSPDGSAVSRYRNAPGEGRQVTRTPSRDRWRPP